MCESHSAVAGKTGQKGGDRQGSVSNPVLTDLQRAEARYHKTSFINAAGKLAMRIAVISCSTCA